jgi:hypothetical protein
MFRISFVGQPSTALTCTSAAMRQSGWSTYSVIRLAAIVTRCLWRFYFFVNTPTVVFLLPSINKQESTTLLFAVFLPGC